MSDPFIQSVRNKCDGTLSLFEKTLYLLFTQNQEHHSLCHLIFSPEFMGLSQHPSATNIQEVT